MNDISVMSQYLCEFLLQRAKQQSIWNWVWKNGAKVYPSLYYLISQSIKLNGLGVVCYIKLETT